MLRQPGEPEYRTVLMDPPWNERGGGRIKRGADRHFEVMKARDMPGAILGDACWQIAEHAHLYCCVTNNFLEDGLWLVKALGFRYVTNLAWLKPHMGIGQYFRGRHELILLAVRGKGMDPSVFHDRRDLSTAIEPGQKGRRIHSRKPVELFERIEARSKGPYLEMFSDLEGEARPGWVRTGKPRKSAAS